MSTLVIDSLTHDFTQHRSVLLNADVGEGFPFDDDIIAIVDIANIACGAHAGDKSSMQQALASVKRHNKFAVAHPGYADKANFGRQSQTYKPRAFAEMMSCQLDTLFALAADMQIPIYGVKAHGALYHDLSKSPELANQYLQAIAPYQKQCKSFNLIVQAHSHFEQYARELGHSVLAEAFIDRRYNLQKKLVSRQHANAVIHDIEEACDQAVRLAIHNAAQSIEGEDVSIQAQTLCLHGDTADALAIAATVANRLKALQSS